MATRDTITLVILVAAGLAGWAWYSEHEKTRATERRHARAQATTAQLNGPPKVREVYSGPHGTLLELRFNIDAMGLGLIETRACYVWRDAAALGSALSCPAEKEIAIPE